MISCSKCGQQWERDSALEVVCPLCHAGVGRRCKRPSGHGCDLHTERMRLALRLGYEGKCPGPEAPHRRPVQGEMF